MSSVRISVPVTPEQMATFHVLAVPIPAGPPGAPSLGIGSGVQSVTAGPGVTIGGTATDPSVALNPASTAATITGTESAKAVTPAGLAGALPFKIVKPTGGDDTAMLNAAAASVAVGGTLWFGAGDYLTTDTITFGSYNVMMSPMSKIIYTGSGNAVYVKTTYDPVIQTFRVQRSLLRWDTTDTTSQGVVIEDSDFGTWDLYIRNFRDGLTLHGNLTGVSYNSFHCRDITDNKRNVYFKRTAAGYVNSNQFTGRLRLNSGRVTYVDTILLDMIETGNGNTFNGVTMEGGVHETTFSVAASNNVFINCRFELVAAGSCKFLAGSTQNMVINGQGAAPSVFSDLGNVNVFFYNIGARIRVGNNAVAPQGVEIEGTSSSHVLLTGEINNLITSELNAGGKLSIYQAVGKVAKPIPIIEMEPATREMRFGHVTSIVAGDAGVLKGWSNAVLGFDKASMRWVTDNTYDLGVAAARPRDLHLGRNANIGGAIDHDGTTVGFYGATPVVKAANPGTATGTDAAIINAVITALRNLGLVT